MLTAVRLGRFFHCFTHWPRGDGSVYFRRTAYGSISDAYKPLRRGSAEMTMDHSQCNLLFEAGKALLVKSGLVCWDDQNFAFAPKYQGDNDSDFEKCWKKTFHPKFGRYIAWVLFSVGSENLVKAACLCNGVGPKPPQKLHELGRYVDKHLPKLCECRNIDGERTTALIDGYKRLTKIRNRDAHNYKANKRRLNFPSVEDLFVPAFNILVETMKAEHHDGTPAG